MKWNVHFDSAGKIVQIDNSIIAPNIENLDCITVEAESAEDINARTHKVKNGKLAKRTKAENRPELWEVQSAVFQELCRTDVFAIPDRPMSDEKRSAWATYRQALRDISKLAGPVEMVAAWPQPPDRLDPIPDLRSRI